MMIALAVVGILLLGGENQALAHQKECGNVEGLGVLMACQNFILKEGPQVSPSAICCSSVKQIGMFCTCKLVTKDIEEIISVEKLTFVAKACGQPVQPGTKCGSYTVPPTSKI